MGAGSDDQLIVCMGAFSSGRQIDSGNLLVCPVQGRDLHTGADLRASQSHKCLRSVDDQIFTGLDDISHIIRQAAARVGDILALCQDQHFAVPLFPLQFSGDLGTCGHAADDQNFHGNILSIFFPLALA